MRDRLNRPRGQVGHVPLRDTTGRYDARVPSHKWIPTTAEQKAAIAAIRRVARRAAKIDEELWQTVQAARDVGVPANHAAREAKRGRSTLYRHIPGKKPDAGGSEAE